MDFLFQQIINGILIGSSYALIAIGFTLIFGILNVLNMAQMEMVTWGAFTAFALVNFLHITSLPLVFCMSAALIAILGLIIERLVIRPTNNPFRDTEMLTPLIATIGCGITLQNLALRIFEPKSLPFPLSIGQGGFDIFGVFVAKNKLVGFFISIFAMCILMVILYKTTLGKKMRATAENPRAALFMGININAIYAIAMGLSAGLGAIGGLILSSIYGVISPFMGSEFGLKGMIVMIVGGVTSLSGAVLGGLLLGILESLTIGFISSGYVDAIAFGILIIFLIIRPQGLLPSFK